MLMLRQCSTGMDILHDLAKAADTRHPGAMS